MFLVAAVLLSPFLLVAQSADEVTATVYYDGVRYNLKYGVQDKEHGAAYGSFNRSQNETGWGVLNVAAGYATLHQYNDAVIMRAAGYLEGALTQPEIYDEFRSQSEFWFQKISGEVLVKVKQFYSDQRNWMTDMISRNKSTSWIYINLIYQQFQGLIDGYTSVAPHDQKLDLFSFDILSGNGDLLDIQAFVDDKYIVNEELYGGRCSVLIKVVPGYENIYASHSTWYIYPSMLRIYKHYSFKLNDKNAASVTSSFSSYPGYLSSVDDFFIIDSKMVMLQTTNSVLNQTLYKQATPHALLAWHRVRLANWLADNGRDWAQYITEYNSGTYNNQYMVLDLKLVNLTNEIKDNALWVVEQIPGYVASGDQTAILREGYWASYNVPFYEKVYRLSGIPEDVQKQGPEVSHDLAPRAKIFRRDQANVKDMSSMKYLMRYNGYKMNDPYAEGSPMKGICSRGDLKTDNPSASGCTDTKVTDYYMALSMKAWAISGPTNQDDLPTFQWSTANITAPHYGQPDVFDFEFVLQSPNVP